MLQLIESNLEQSPRVFMNNLVKDLKDSLKGKEQYAQRAERILDRLEEKVVHQGNRSLASAQSLVNIIPPGASEATPQKRLDTPLSRAF